MNHFEKIKHLIGLSAIAFILMGCPQDPYADKSDDVRNAPPPHYSEKPGEGVDSGRVKLESVSPFYEFYETQEGSANFQGRVLIDGIKFTLSVINPEDFPGHTFDPATGTFLWTPAKGVTGDQRMLQKTLSVQLTTTPDSYGKIITKVINVPLYTHRKLGEPRITNITGLPALLFEGDYAELTVAFIDEDASDRPEGYSQIRTFVATGSSGFLSRFKALDEHPQLVSAQDHTWTMRYGLDLRDLKLDTDKLVLEIGFTVVSPFGISTKDYEIRRFNILSRANDQLQITFDDNYEIKAPIGQITNFSFVAADPTERGNLSIKFTAEAHKSKFESSCSTINYDSASFRCYLKVKPTVAEKFRVAVLVTNNQNGQSIQVLRNLWVNSLSGGGQ